MNVLPRLLYLFQTLPVTDIFFLRKIKHEFLQFLWPDCPPRIKTETLAMPKCSGTMRFPDPVQYYKISHLSPILDWCNHTKVKGWLSLEQLILFWVPPIKSPR